MVVAEATAAAVMGLGGDCLVLGQFEWRDNSMNSFKPFRGTIIVVTHEEQVKSPKLS
jgi:hypothetical protein